MPPEMIDHKFLLFRDGEEPRSLDWRLESEAQYLSKEEYPSGVVFIAHGYLEKISFSRWITNMANGYKRLGYAVIVIDWRGGNGVQYWQSAANVRTVGATIGHAIGIWGIADRTLFVGFSLGGQMIVEASNYLKNKFGQQINECHGLDPAGPFYDECSEIQLDKKHCRLVQSIHTSAADIPTLQFAVVRFGTYKKSGHCDYWINCGFNQGPCVDLDFPDFIKGVARLSLASDGEILDWTAERVCSHWRAPNIYNEVLTGTSECPAFSCPTCSRTHFCVPPNAEAKIGSNNTLLPFSRCTPDDDVNYYVKSGSFKPFCDQ